MQRLPSYFWGASFFLVPLAFFPWVAEPFTQSKWLMFYFSALGAGVYLFFQKNLIFYSRPRTLGDRFGWLLFFCGLFFGASLLKNTHTLNTLFLLRGLSACLLFKFYQEQFNKKNWNKTFLIVSLLAGSIAIAYEDIALLLFSDYDVPPNLFNHVNMSSEFYGFFFTLLFIFCRLL